MSAARDIIEIDHTNEMPAPATSNAVTPLGMIDRALELNASPETLERLFALNERHEANQARKAFDEAMAAAKAEIPTIRKNRTVDFTSSKGRTHYRHEDLAEIASTVNPILSRHGLSYRFRTSSPPNEPVTVTCILSHRLGHFEENTLTGPRDDSGNKNSHQQVGSALTYLQRMVLKASLGLAASEDDDARATSQPPAEKISDEQRDELLSLLSETKSDVAAFCELGRVESVSEINKADFKSAKAMLLRKKSSMGGNGNG